MSAWAGPARPMTAAASPLAAMAANPNFFILVPSSVSVLLMSCRPVWCFLFAGLLA